MRKNPSLKINAILNIIRSLMGIVFPLISYPYVSRILNPSGIGKVNFASSVVGYFVMFAGLGINSYAIKEGVRYKDNKEALGKFSTEIFIINVISSLAAYLVFGISLGIPKFSDYKMLLIVSSLSIAFNSLSFEWLYSILEDFAYITVRAIGVQCLSLLALFCFVKEEQDYVIYALITAIAAVGSNVLNFIHARRFVRLFGYGSYSFRPHLKPIFVIFGMSIASQIYLNSDTVMLGFMKSDIEVGYYSAAVKINRIIITLVTAITGVLLPRMSYYVKTGAKEDFQFMVRRVLNFILMFAFPCATGLFLLSEPLIYVFSGAKFLPAVTASRLLAFNIVLSPLNGILAYQILLPHDLEGVTLRATIAGCVVNVVLNIPAIYYLSQSGAAITTLLAEGCVLFYSWKYVNKIVSMKSVIKNVFQYALGCMGISVFYMLVRHLGNNNWWILMGTFVGGASIYMIIILLCKNELLLDVMAGVKNTRKR